MNDANLAAKVDSFLALIMAIIFCAGVTTMYLPSAKVNGLKSYTAWMLTTAALLFLASSTWLIVEDFMTSPYTPLLIWLRVLARALNLIATLAFIYHVVRHESPLG